VNCCFSYTSTSETENPDEPFEFSYPGQLPTKFSTPHFSETFCVEMTNMN